MASRQAMMADMQAAQKKLDDLVAQMNAAPGPEKVDRIAAVVNEMAAMHKTMCTQMMAAPAPESPDSEHGGHHNPNVR